MNRSDIKIILRERGLRATAPRIAVVQLLSEAKSPVSFSEVKGMMAGSDWDAATIYRNLIKLKETGLATVVSNVDGQARYALVTENSHTEHAHPHFVCDDCGQISCLPESIVSGIAASGGWSASLQSASLQFRGECPDCR